MTSDDRTPEMDELDELASALLDGEATAAEEARAGEPDVAARIARFAAVARRVAAEPAPAVDPARRDATVDAALAAFKPAPVATPARVVPIRRSWPRWLPAAAAIAAVAALGVAVVSIGDGDGDDSLASGAADRSAETAAPLAESGEGAGGDAAVSAPAPGAGGGVSAASAAVADLGDLAGPEELAVASRALLDSTFAADDAGASAEDGAAGDEVADADPGTAARDAGVPCVDRFGTSLVTVATARLGGVAVTVGLFADGPARTYIALDQLSCQPLVSGDL